MSKLASKLANDERKGEEVSEEEDISNIQAQLEYDSDSEEDEEEEAKRTEAIDNDFDIIDLLGDSDDEASDETVSENSMGMVAIKTENVNLKQELDEPDTDLTEEDLETQEDNGNESTSLEPSPPQVDDRMTRNLVPQYKQFGLCKLCYMSYPTEEGMKRHVEVVHKDHEERHLEHISFKDLVVPCEWCPEVKFLSERIMMTHAKIQHNKTLKPSTAECKVLLQRMRNPTEYLEYALAPCVCVCVV